MDLCKYSHVLGEPKKGIHSIRIYNIAIMDVLMTIIGSYIISYFSNIHFTIVLISMFVLGIFLHRLFCVRTTIDKYLFPNV